MEKVMTDVKREILVQNTGTKESPFFDTNFGQTDILTNIVIPVVFIVIGKFQTTRAHRESWAENIGPVIFGFVPILGLDFQFSYTWDAGQFSNSPTADNQRFEEDNRYSCL